MFLPVFALVTAGVTFALLLLGGMVHATGSSLACPDWPLCYGQVFPEMVGGVAIEHSHRLLASFVGVLTVVLGVGLWRRGSKDAEQRSLRWLGAGLVALVVFQGVLGGITVVLRLPTAVSTAHLGTSMIFFSLLFYAAARTWPRERFAEVPTVSADTMRWSLVATVALYVQILLGALVRHTGAGLACGKDPILCTGALWPDWAPSQLHMVHRFGAVLVTILIVVACLRLMRAAPKAQRTFRRAAHLPMVLVALQVGLGMLSVWTVLHAHTVTTHLGVGALLLASMVGLLLLLRFGRRADAAPTDARATRSETSARADLIDAGAAS